MASLVTTRGIYSGSDAHMAGHSRLYKPDATKRGVLWFHATGDSELEAWGLDAGGASAARPVAQVFTDLGLPVMCINAGGKNWGNDAAQTLASAAYSYLQGTLGAAPGKVIVAAVSMGGLLALNWARANPTLVEAVVLFYPVVNLVACHDATGGASNYATEINTAYTDLAGYNAAKAAHDPAQNAASYTGVPIRMYRSTADAAVGSANQDAFATAVGGSAFQTVSLGASGHPDMSVIPLGDLAAFVAAHA